VILGVAMGSGLYEAAFATPVRLYGRDSRSVITDRQGVLMVPGRVAQALAPWLFGVCLGRWGASAIWLTAALGLAAFGALMLLSRPSDTSRGAFESESRALGARSHQK
jgi:hypothetical protein